MIAALAPMFVAETPARAGPVALTAAEIDSLLSGNTAIGVWGGDAYRQWFAEDGATIYSPKAGRSSRGRWRVNASTNEFESWWERAGWSGYGVAKDGERYLWIWSGDPQPFKVAPGERLAWP